MDQTLFLYLDILGFSDLVQTNERLDLLYTILDGAQLHRDSCYQSIVFSDTVIAYNRYPNLQGNGRANEVMFLIELTQEIFHRLIGTGIFFKAIITEGEFTHRKLNKIEAYYGKALVQAFNSSKGLAGIGLYLDRSLRESNLVFRYKEFSASFDFIYLTHLCSSLTPWLNREVDKISKTDHENFPLHPDLLLSSDLHFLIYPELVHLKEIFFSMNNHPDSHVRSKYLTTWNMYVLAYPGLTRSLVDHNFEPNGLSDLDWNEAAARFLENKAYYQKKT